ncbi:hypothetical protein [Streptomyces griseoluteus]|uniref:hypothetical protein n=1 Tax=Streptomyces griseoluteus TaxID=29306 RepID=UPI003700FCA6
MPPPSTCASPAYALITPSRPSSGDNEVRLDFTTDARGTGGATDQHTWGLRRDESASVVIQDRPGDGATRVACFTVPFGWVTG